MILSLTGFITDAAELTVVPRLIVNEIYTDNLDLVAVDPQQDLITQIIPGISIDAAGRRVSGTLDYAYETLFYRENTDRDADYNQLQANGSVELYRDTLFLNGAGSVRQQAIDTGDALIIDNINPANRTNIATYSVGPLWRSRYGNAFIAEASYEVGRVNYTDTTELSDADLTVARASMESGSRFDTTTWSIFYSLNETDRGPGDASVYENVEGELDTRVTSRLVFLLTGGYNNDQAAELEGIQNGYYGSAGLRWQPTPFWTVEGSYGSRLQEASVSWQPSPRSEMFLGYMNRSLGIDAGERWTALVHRDFRRVGFELIYAEDTTNQQFIDLAGSSPPPLLAIGGEQINPNAIIFQPTDEDFLRRIVRLETSLLGIRGTLNFNISAEQRDYLESGDTDSFAGADIFWVREFSPRTHSEVSGGVLNRNFETIVSDDTYYYAGLGFVRLLSRNLEAFIRYRYIRARSEDDSANYRENRAVAGFQLIF